MRADRKAAGSGGSGRGADGVSPWLLVRRYGVVAYILVSAVLLMQNVWIPGWPWLVGWTKTYRAVVGVVVMGLAFFACRALLDLHDWELCTRRRTARDGSASGEKPLPSPAPCPATDPFLAERRARARRRIPRPARTGGGR